MRCRQHLGADNFPQQRYLWYWKPDPSGFLSSVLDQTQHRLKCKVIKLGRRKNPDNSRKTKISVADFNLTNLGGFLPCFLWFANSLRNDLMFISGLDVLCKNIYPFLSFSFSSVYFNAKWKIITPTYTTIQTCCCEMGLEQHSRSPAQCMDLYWLASGQQRWQTPYPALIPYISRDLQLFLSPTHSYCLPIFSHTFAWNLRTQNILQTHPPLCQM